MIRRFFLLLTTCLSLLALTAASAQAYPFYAQMSYDTPREATGKIVCANCHLGEMQTRVELPQAVVPNQVFDLEVSIPYDLETQQLLGDGSKGGLNVGAVVILPEGFRLATEEEMNPEQLEEMEGVYVEPYSEEQQNILLVGPLPGEEYQEILFPVMAPDPNADPSLAFMKYYVYVGGNRGRGQLNPDGTLSNNNTFTSPVTGTIRDIMVLEDPYSDAPPELEALVDLSTAYPDTRLVTFDTESGLQAMAIPPGPDLLVGVGDSVTEGETLTENPNVGGFGQVERELVLQSPTRVKWLMAFLAAVFLAQVMLVLKKKQVEQIQAAEILG